LRLEVPPRTADPQYLRFAYKKDDPRIAEGGNKDSVLSVNEMSTLKRRFNNAI
jgi:hypothetical protein